MRPVSFRILFYPPAASDRIRVVLLGRDQKIRQKRRVDGIIGKRRERIGRREAEL